VSKESGVAHTDISDLLTHRYKGRPDDAVHRGLARWLVDRGQRSAKDPRPPAAAPAAAAPVAAPAFAGSEQPQQVQQKQRMQQQKMKLQEQVQKLEQMPPQVQQQQHMQQQKMKLQEQVQKLEQMQRLEQMQQQQQQQQQISRAALGAPAAVKAAAPPGLDWAAFERLGHAGGGSQVSINTSSNVVSAPAPAAWHGRACEDCKRISANYGLPPSYTGQKTRKRWCSSCGARHGAVNRNGISLLQAESSVPKPVGNAPAAAPAAVPPAATAEQQPQWAAFETQQIAEQFAQQMSRAGPRAPPAAQPGEQPAQWAPQSAQWAAQARLDEPQARPASEFRAPGAGPQGTAMQGAMQVAMRGAGEVAALKQRYAEVAGRAAMGPHVNQPDWLRAQIRRVEEDHTRATQKLAKASRLVKREAMPEEPLPEVAVRNNSYDRMCL
jgi:hypothetical protein